MESDTVVTMSSTSDGVAAATMALAHARCLRDHDRTWPTAGPSARDRMTCTVCSPSAMSASRGSEWGAPITWFESSRLRVTRRS